MAKFLTAFDPANETVQCQQYHNSDEKDQRDFYILGEEHGDKEFRSVVRKTNQSISKQGKTLGREAVEMEMVVGDPTSRQGGDGKNVIFANLVSIR